MDENSSHGNVVRRCRTDLVATVMFEYSAQQVDELSLRVDEIIEDVLELDDVWCSGVISGKRGKFPRNFVTLSKRTNYCSPVFAASAGTQSKSEKRCADDPQRTPAGTVPLPLSRTEKTRGKRRSDNSLNALTSSSASHSTQTKVAKLMTSPMKAAEVATPLAFSLATEGYDSRQQQEASSTNLGACSAMSREDTGHCALQIPRSVQTQSTATRHGTQTTQASPKKPTTMKQSSAASAAVVIRQKAVVKVSYEAVDGDEISVQVGDVVDVISEVTEDEGWWKVQLGGKEGVLPKIFLESTASSVATESSSEEKESTEWLTLVPHDKQSVSTVHSTGTPSLNTDVTTSTCTSPGGHQVAIIPNAMKVESIVNFQSEQIGRVLLLDQRIQRHINLVANIHSVTVSADTLSKAVLSGSPQGVAYVHNEMSTLAAQVKQDIKAHCMLIPILFSHQARDMITTIRERYAVEISLVSDCGQFQPVQELLHAGRQIRLLQKVHFKAYMIPLGPISEFSMWSFLNQHSLWEPLPASVNQLLNNRYNVEFGGQEQFQFNGVSYVADLSAMALVDITSGKSATLHKEPQPTLWSFVQDQQGNLRNFVQSDSDAIESMYRYGGSSITLSGANLLLEFTSMHQLDLSTAKTSLIKRYPPPLSSILPDYNCRLVVTGHPDSLSVATKEMMENLDALCVRTQFICQLQSISQHWRDVVAVHTFNVFRQFCVKVDNLQVREGVLVGQLQGDKAYCEMIQAHVKAQLMDLVLSVMVQESALRSSPSTNFPPEWEPQQLDVELKLIKPNSHEWNEIDEMVCKTLSAVKLVQIERVQNHQLWEKYALEKNHMDCRNSGLVNEKLLFHGTRKNDPKSIVQSLRGIDFRCSRRDHQLLWGTGAYFAVNASYSDRYCHNSNQVNARQMIIVKVLTGRTCIYKNPKPNLTRPPPLFAGSNLLYDTVCGNSGGSDIFVVYDQDRAYPAYIVSYHVHT